MRTTGLFVRKFRSVALERAFRTDYARRFAGQRRIAVTVTLLLWCLFARRDWWLLLKVDPGILSQVMSFRVAGLIGMAVPIGMMWGARALDERWVVGLLFVWLLSGWATLLKMMELYPPALAFREIFPEFLLILFTTFTLLRLRAITATWLIGLCAVSFHLTLYLWPRNASNIGAGWVSRGSVLSIMYVAGVIVCVQFEQAARRDFMFRRSLSAAKARAERVSRKLAKQNQRMKEIVEEKERFFASAYHDIQQPLAAINLFVRSAQSRVEHHVDPREDLQVIEQTAQDTLDMFKGVQDYSELGSYAPRLATINVHALLGDILYQYRETARTRGIRFEISALACRSALIVSDRSLLKRALSNLVSNAIKNTATGGVVIGWVRLPDKRIRIDVWDTGVGIASAHRDAIFAEYYQINNPGRDRARGLGLGLSIVRRIIGILPGHGMRFSSVEGRGSRFSVYAPVATEPSVAPHEIRLRGTSSADLLARYILLCDDEPIILEGLRRLFVSAGAIVDTVTSIGDVEAMLTPDSRSPDLVVTDIWLADGPSGIQLAKRVREHFSWAGVLPVAFITGELFSPRFLREFDKPFVLLRKSLDPERMLADVSQFLAAQHAEAASRVEGH